MSRKILEVVNAEKYYGTRGNVTKALDDISFGVNEGEFLGIMGASGSGKTTLLNCISTIDRLSSGKVLIRGKDISELKGSALNAFRRDELGFIFQDFNLLDTMTGYENIALALSIRNADHAQIEEKVNRIASTLEIGDVLEKFPYEMSGGQKQRVAAARAVVKDPGLILADEPTGALDSKSSGTLMESIVKLNREFSSTILMVTHDAFSASYASRIIFIKDGKLFTELLRDPEKPRKAFFEKIVETSAVLGGSMNELI
ncbi:MAG: ABC transporter ATP-binding protein [Lachnospiraceae bacterium]|nr:ABC transporter ATP-binding protein [Lachnospiraceae bacterium]